MHSGDLAVLDAEGYCRIAGRLKDVVIRGGENVVPREVEEFLHRHPGIADCQVSEQQAAASKHLMRAGTRVLTHS